jgi:acetyltransferase-like isoleucine patch superfamily enzyme
MIYVHESALIEEGVTIGDGSRIWHDVHVRKGASIGERCILGKGVYVDADVPIGDDCKLQNYACIYRGARLGRGVFAGPHVVFANDMRPRATDPQFKLLGDEDWEAGSISVADGAAIGANSTILPGITIGRWAMIGAGSVVRHDVPDYALAAGSPARLIGWVCACGDRVTSRRCPRCGEIPSDHPLRNNES